MAVVASAGCRAATGDSCAGGAGGAGGAGVEEVPVGGSGSGLSLASVLKPSRKGKLWKTMEKRPTC